MGQRPRADRAFERLYRRHVGDVYRYAFGVLANPADAEDVTQAAFLNAYRAFQRGQRPERPLSWLIAIAHNVCRQRFREAARRPREVMIDPEMAARPAEDDDGGPWREDVRRALSQLGLNQRAALVMRELEGRSYTEIAEVLGISVSAVETLIFRARRALREQLEGALLCGEVERAISRQLDGMLTRGERAGLRAHLRACPECALVARRFRAQRAALKGSAAVPLPPSLAVFSPGGGSVAVSGAVLGGGLGVKATAIGAAALLAAGAGSKTVRPPTAEPARHPAGSALVSGRSASPLVAPTVTTLIPVLAPSRDEPAGSRRRAPRLQTTAASPGETARPPERPLTPASGPGTSSREHPVSGRPGSGEQPVKAIQERGAARRDRATQRTTGLGRRAGKPEPHASRPVKREKRRPTEAAANPPGQAPAGRPSPGKGAGRSSRPVALPASPAGGGAPANQAAAAASGSPPAAGALPGPAAPQASTASALPEQAPPVVPARR